MVSRSASAFPQTGQIDVPGWNHGNASSRCIACTATDGGSFEDWVEDLNAGLVCE
jgi:hypothetical protein